ncbi:MAG: hypothetical protein QXH37_04315 [Candidatus Bathyarchaeia archaeon]
MPWVFLYLEIGRFVGPYLSFVIFVLILIGMLIGIPLFSYKILTKLKKNTRGHAVISNASITFLIMLLLSLMFIQQVSVASRKIDIFVAENKDLNFTGYVNKVVSFLNNNIKKSYNTPEACFEIDDYFYGVGGHYVMDAWGLNRAAIIVYQGWGACGQTAILIEELLKNAGYETRQARFKNIDHQWAEVKYNNTWLIVDPWYIGNLIEVKDLKNAKPEFQNATGVIVQYSNGTTADANQEHGYFP